MSLPILSLKVFQGKILDWTLKISLNQLYSLNLYFLALLKDVGAKPIVTSSEVIDLIAYAFEKRFRHSTSILIMLQKLHNSRCSETNRLLENEI